MPKQILLMQNRNSGKMAFIPKYTVSEFAELKNCSRQTIYQNKDNFTWITVPGAKVQKILLDKKALDFKPDIRKLNKKYK